MPITEEAMTNRPSEDDLIARFFAPIAGPQGLGLLDDAAVLTPPPGADLVITKDAIVASVHFFTDDPPAEVARKALRINLSDLAAKGAEPLGFLLALALPGDWTTEWLAAFAQGLGEDAAAYRCPLFGGDTVKTPGPLMVSITALGLVESGRLVARTGVKRGDVLYVSGAIGDAALGLQARRGLLPSLAPEHRDFLVDRYLLPRPRLALAPVLARFANGGMDVSDGLVGDLTKMLRVSGVTARVALAKLPLSAAADAAVAGDSALFEIAATGGDDYEILASVALQNTAAFEAGAAEAGVAVTRIGQALAGADPPRFFGRDGAEVAFRRGAYSHF
jgi:thiamine-monophosphate kinase